MSLFLKDDALESASFSRHNLLSLSRRASPFRAGLEQSLRSKPSRNFSLLSFRFFLFLSSSNVRPIFRPIRFSDLIRKKKESLCNCILTIVLESRQELYRGNRYLLFVESYVKKLEVFPSFCSKDRLEFKIKVRSNLKTDRSTPDRNAKFLERLEEN